MQSKIRRIQLIQASNEVILLYTLFPACFLECEGFASDSKSCDSLPPWPADCEWDVGVSGIELEVVFDVCFLRKFEEANNQQNNQPDKARQLLKLRCNCDSFRSFNYAISHFFRTGLTGKSVV